MSVDPTAAALAGGTADIGAVVDAELAQLAADGAALRATLVEDAVVTARVLPSNGLTDLLEIAGRRVAAALPPTVRPGDVLQVRVTGFDGERILVQIVGTGAAGTPAPATPIAPEPAVFVAASIVPAAPVQPPSNAPAPDTAVAGEANPPPVSANAAGAAQPPPNASASAAAQATSSAPAVAAPPQIGDAAPSPPPTGASPPDPTAPARHGAGAVGTPPPARGFAPAIVGATSTPPGLSRPNVVPPQPNSIEARVAASRAATAPVVPDAGETRPRDAPGAASRAPSRAAGAVPASGQRFAIPPPITAKGAAETAAPLDVRVAAAGAARPTRLSVYAQPAALLRALRLPLTPTNVAAATLALDHPDRLPVALAALERALPFESADANITTLKTLLSFVGRIDPRSPMLAAQVEAYVEHVVDGAEPKLATLLAASRAATVPATETARAASSSVASAIAAERTMALGADLKQTLLGVAADVPAASPLSAPLAAALTALTSVQIHAAQALAADPSGFTFTVPLATAHGGANARISVKRDAQRGSPARLDGENFRVAFVLDTAHYGTIAIDLVTVGRDVTVEVRTEASTAMRAFRDALGTLTSRLEALHYRVASAGAALGTVSTVAVEAPPAAPPDRDTSVDRSA